ncbi:MAG: hypothetical protein H7Y38_17855 [Armatimonadetes bacterium]|nr:hypothetical protein [Armatimonadota bacterium]
MARETRTANKKPLFYIFLMFGFCCVVSGGVWLTSAMKAELFMDNYKSYGTVSKAKQTLQKNPNDTKALQTMYMDANKKVVRTVRTGSMEERRKANRVSLHYAKRLYFMEPGNPVYTDMYAGSLVINKQYDEAIPLFEKVAKSDTVLAPGARSILRKLRAGTRSTTQANEEHQGNR